MSKNINEAQINKGCKENMMKKNWGTTGICVYIH